MAEPTVLEFRAMGSPGRIVVGGGPPDLPQRARAIIERLEQRWSRFRPDSEVSAINRTSGLVTIVSEETYALFDKAVSGQRLTGGWFNPLMLDQLEHHGYDGPWDDRRPPIPADGPVAPATIEAISLYPGASAVRLPPGCRFDPGGIGKGLAIDLAMEACLAEGATTASVELGGDLRVHGRPWYGPSWTIPVADPFDRRRDVASFIPEHGALTTSTTMRRRWETDGLVLHHLLDPTTGRPSTSDLVAVTTCSSVAWWAEVAAKAALLSGSERATAMLADLDTPGIAVRADGAVLGTEGPAMTLRATGTAR